MSKILIILSCILCLQLQAQDFSFSQFYEKPALRNPALTGLFNGDIRVSTAYRDQWASVTVPFRTSALSVEHKWKLNDQNDFVTIGFQSSVDGAGDIRLKRTQLQPFFNFSKSLSEERDEYISLAFMGGLVNSQFDATQLKLGDQFRNGSYSASNPTQQVITATGYKLYDASVGLSYVNELSNGTKFYFGAAMYHFNKPIIQTVTGNQHHQLEARHTANLGIHYPINEYQRMYLFADYLSQGGSKQILGGMMYGFDLNEAYEGLPYSFYLGVFLRANDAMIPMIKLNLNQISFGLSYDVNISSLKTASNLRGGMEFTLVYTSFLKINNPSLDMVRCFRF